MYPAIRPMISPMLTLMAATVTPMMSDTRAPYTVRL